MESLFFNNQLFLNVIRTIILYSYCRAFGGGEGEDALGILFLLFFQGFILDCFVFFLAISVLLASVLSLTVAKIWYVAKIVKQNISSFCKLLCDLDCGFIIPFQLINDKHPQLVESISWAPDMWHETQCVCNFRNQKSQGSAASLLLGGSPDPDSFWVKLAGTSDHGVGARGLPTTSGDRELGLETSRAHLDSLPRMSCSVLKGIRGGEI